jgi:excinuclease ABC subunit A
VDQGNTVVTIEHNLDVLLSSDYIIDLGPEGGMEGGSIVTQGTPEEIIKSRQGYTSAYLQEYARQLEREDHYERKTAS